MVRSIGFYLLHSGELVLDVKSSILDKVNVPFIELELKVLVQNIGALLPMKIFIIIEYLNFHKCFADLI